MSRRLVSLPTYLEQEIVGKTSGHLINPWGFSFHGTKGLPCRLVAGARGEEKHPEIAKLLSFTNYGSTDHVSGWDNHRGTEAPSMPYSMTCLGEILMVALDLHHVPSTHVEPEALHYNAGYI